MAEKYLDKVYDARGVKATRDLYDAWSDSYEDEVGSHGYATPKRCADALASQLDDLTRPVLDFGCGTGLSGQALFDAGMTTLDGVDLSAEMLSGAAGKGIYRNLRQIEAGETPVQDGARYAAIAAIGVIGAGAAPAETFDLLLDAVEPNGLFVLSYNDHTLEEPAYEGRMNAWIDRGAATLMFKEHGPHLPGIDLFSTVYVIRKS